MEIKLYIFPSKVEDIKRRWRGKLNKKYSWVYLEVEGGLLWAKAEIGELNPETVSLGKSE